MERNQGLHISQGPTQVIHFAAVSCPSATQHLLAKTQAGGSMMVTLHCTVHAGPNGWLLAYVTVDTLSNMISHATVELNLIPPVPVAVSFQRP